MRAAAAEACAAAPAPGTPAPTAAARWTPGTGCNGTRSSLALTTARLHHSGTQCYSLWRYGAALLLVQVRQPVETEVLPAQQIHLGLQRPIVFMQPTGVRQLTRHAVLRLLYHCLHLDNKSVHIFLRPCPWISSNLHNTDSNIK